MVTKLKVKGEKKSDEAQNEENVEILQFDEPKVDAIYRQSKFYKTFKKLTFRPNYDNTTQQLNNFYCPSYCGLLLSHFCNTTVVDMSQLYKKEKQFKC